MIKTTFFQIVLGAILAPSVLLSSDALPLADNYEQKTFSAVDLSRMAKTNTMGVAVSLVTGAAYGTGAPVLGLDEIEEIIEATAASSIREALLMAAGAEGKRKAKEDASIIEFAKTTNPAATCATEDSAGGLGADLCVALCNEKSPYLVKGSRKGACHLLCSLAVAPCARKGSFSWGVVMVSSWGTWSTKWAKSTLATLSNWKIVKSLRSVLRSRKVKLLFVILAYLAARFCIWAKSLGVEDRIRATSKRQLVACDEAYRWRGTALRATWERQAQRQALYAWHDFAAWATYRAHEENAEVAAMALEDAAAAAMAKAVAV